MAPEEECNLSWLDLKGTSEQRLVERAKIIPRDSQPPEDNSARDQETQSANVMTHGLTQPAGLERVSQPDPDAQLIGIPGRQNIRP